MVGKQQQQLVSALRGATANTPARTVPTPGPPAATAPKKIPSTPLERAAAALKPAGLPGRLPCRDQEQDRIIAHLRAGVRHGGTDQVLYISGMPGTGKTAALLWAIQELQDKSTPTPEQSFLFVHTNAMRLGTPNAIFSELLRHLPIPGKHSASGAHGEVMRFFGDRRASDPVVVLLIDEIDQLVTKSQNVLYGILELLSMRARLVVAAISNTMDLPERMLPRVASRFEVIRVDFWPYTRDQIHKILNERLRCHDASAAFKSDALKICSARVAAGSGDVRKALQLCRRAVDIRQKGLLAQTSGSGAVEISHLDAAAKDLLYANPTTTFIAKLSRKTRRFLVGVLLELRRKESDAVPLRKVVSRYERLTAICCGDRDAYSSGSHAEDATFIADRLAAVSLLGQHGKDVSTGQGPMLTLCGGLDVEDLKTALLEAEEDAGIREVIKD